MPTTPSLKRTVLKPPSRWMSAGCYRCCAQLVCPLTTSPTDPGITIAVGDSRTLLWSPGLTHSLCGGELYLPRETRPCIGQEDRLVAGSTSRALRAASRATVENRKPSLRVRLPSVPPEY